MKTINSILFVITKSGYTSAIINNQFSVVKKESGYNVYQNISRGTFLESTPELIQEFTAQFTMFHEAKEKAREDARKEAARIEQERIAKIESEVSGMSPQDFGDYTGIKSIETASHWSDLYEGRSSFAFIIDNDEDLELLEIAERVNNWGGEFGELSNRAGEHHYKFNSVYDLNTFRKDCERYFDDKYIQKSKEIEHDYFLERVKEAESMDDVQTIMDEYNGIEEGYYSEGASLVMEGFDFSSFWGYGYDVHSYYFGYRLPSKDIFYNGVEEVEEEDEEE